MGWFVTVHMMHPLVQVDHGTVPAIKKANSSSSSREAEPTTEQLLSDPVIRNHLCNRLKKKGFSREDIAWVRLHWSVSSPHAAMLRDKYVQCIIRRRPAQLEEFMSAMAGR